MLPHDTLLPNELAYIYITQLARPALNCAGAKKQLKHPEQRHNVYVWPTQCIQRDFPVDV